MNNKKAQNSIAHTFLKYQQNNEVKKITNSNRELKEQIDRNYLVCETNEYAFNFQQIETIRSFGNSIIHCGKCVQIRSFF